jgi:uracil DNA glycosylase
VSSTLKNLSDYTTGIIYVLLGKQAQSFEPYIDRRFQDIIRERHPAYYVRTHKTMPIDLFVGINKLLNEKNGEKIKWIDE